MKKLWEIYPPFEIVKRREYKENSEINRII